MGKWSYRSYPNEKGERFAARQVWHKKETSENVINFWHMTPAHTFLYTFKPTEKYNGSSEWSEKLCQDLLAELRSPKPSMTVVRYAMDGQQVFSDMAGKVMPKPPEAPKPVPQPDPMAKELREQRRKEHEERVQKAKDKKSNSKKRRQIEAAKTKEPAPFILFGTHDTGGSKEYAWQLTPDKPKRQGIVPGDRVLVWTKYGFDTVTVTRIEPAEGKKQPAARVKKKLFPADMERTDEENV